MKKSKLSIVALLSVLTLCACGGTSSSTSSNGGATSSSPTVSTSQGFKIPFTLEDMDKKDDAVYDYVLGDFAKKYDIADNVADDDERYVKYAEAEAELLDSAVMVPMTSGGGSYAMSRVAYRTSPYVRYGSDSDRLKGRVIANDFIKKEDTAELKKLWQAAYDSYATDAATKVEYDPEAYLTSHGYQIVKTLKTSFSTLPDTLDVLATSKQTDTEYLVNTIDGLVEYDNLGNLNPAIASEVPTVENGGISEDGTVYTFHLRKDVKWYTSDGTVYGDVTAYDFVNGLRHMCDAQEGLEYLIEDLIVGASDYIGGYTTDFDDVGIKALDEYTLQITLNEPKSYFLSMLTYSIFLPLNSSFFISKGGAFGVDEYQTAAGSKNYTYGTNSGVDNILYCGAYRFSELTNMKLIKLVKNEGYYNKDSVHVDEITYTYNDGSDANGFYDSAVNGDFVGASLSDELIQRAKNDGNFDKYAYISATDATTYFQGWNLNRKSFSTAADEACTSVKKNDQTAKTRYATAILNKNFRKALSYALNKETINAAAVGSDLGTTSLRNMLTCPDFVVLSKDVTDANGHTFKAGTQYGDLVQYYLGGDDAEIQVADGQDGWHNEDLAKKYMEIAIEELKATDPNFFSSPITIEYLSWGASTTLKNQAQVFKANLEQTFGTDIISVNVFSPMSSSTYYAAGYTAATSADCNYDAYAGSGWGPDFADPSTYLETFLSDGNGYMTKVIGLY
jgi:ABC-type oligopeptide transport system substrate-binding subunit